MKVSLPNSKAVAAGIAGIVALLVAVTCILGSGGGPCEDLDCRSFFSPEIIQSPHESPFFLADNSFYEPFTLTPPAKDPQEDMEVVNLEEWQKYFGSEIPKEQLANLLRWTRRLYIQPLRQPAEQQRLPDPGLRVDDHGR